MKRIKYIIAITALIIPSLLLAQTSSPDVLASGGGFVSGPGFTNSFTIGQGSLPQTFVAGSFMLTQGFQQPADFSTGILPVQENFQRNIYPNPSNGIFFLDYNLENNATVNIELLDITGRIVYVETSTRSEGKQTQEVQLENFPDGMYFIRCTISTSEKSTQFNSKITLTK